MDTPGVLRLSHLQKQGYVRKEITASLWRILIPYLSSCECTKMVMFSSSLKFDAQICVSSYTNPWTVAHQASYILLPELPKRHVHWVWCHQPTQPLLSLLFPTLRAASIRMHRKMRIMIWKAVDLIHASKLFQSVMESKYGVSALILPVWYGLVSSDRWWI